MQQLLSLQFILCISPPGVKGDLYFSFYHTDILHPQVRPLGTQKFKMWNSRDIDFLCYKPDDLYWDSKDKCIAFSAHHEETDWQSIPTCIVLSPKEHDPIECNPQIDHHNTKKNFFRQFPDKASVWTYNPWTEETKHVDIPRTIELNDQRDISFCGLPTSADGPLVLGCIWGDGLWMKEKQSASLNRYTKITQGPNQCFPRMSPNGDSIAWIAPKERIFDAGEYERITHEPCLHLYVMKLKGRGKGSIRRLTEKPLRISWECPFCWSPDGKSIAYTDGKKVYIADI